MSIAKPSAAATAAFSVRAVSYNVLCSHLALPEQYPTMDPFNLDPKNRLPIVLKKLEEEINMEASSTSYTSLSMKKKTTYTNSNSNADAKTNTEHNEKKVILCLQEVSYDWAGALHAFFANKGYHFLTGLYGRKFNGYMGIAIAYPTQYFETVDVGITRLADEREWPPEDVLYPHKKKREDDDDDQCCHFLNFSRVWERLVVRPVKAVLNFRKDKKEKEKDPMEHWTIAKRRQNILLTTILKDKETGTQFVIGNYHMPCCFYNTKVMALHSELAAQHVQRIAKNNNNIPYILAGDWNLKPQESTYRLLTTGKLDKNDAAYPNLPPPETTKPKSTKQTQDYDYNNDKLNDHTIVRKNTSNEFYGDHDHSRFDDWAPAIDPMRSVYAGFLSSSSSSPPSTPNQNGQGPNNNNQEPSSQSAFDPLLGTMPVKQEQAVSSSLPGVDPLLGQMPGTPQQQQQQQQQQPSELDPLLGNTPQQSQQQTPGSSDPLLGNVQTTNTTIQEDRHGEPEFTNYATTRDDPPDIFCDTLDYIFVSPEWKICNVKQLPKRNEIDGPLPNLRIGEPSDHVLIAANLQLGDVDGDNGSDNNNDDDKSSINGPDPSDLSVIDDNHENVSIMDDFSQRNRKNRNNNGGGDFNNSEPQFSLDDSSDHLFGLKY